MQEDFSSEQVAKQGGSRNSQAASESLRWLELEGTLKTIWIRPPAMGRDAFL